MNIEEFLKDYYNSNKNKYGTTEDELYDIAYDVKEDFDTWYDEFIDETILPTLKNIIKGEQTMENLDVYFVNNKDNKEEKTYNGMTENREKAIEFMEQNEVLTNLKNEKWY